MVVNPWSGRVCWTCVAPTSAPHTAPALILAGASLLKRCILLFIRPQFGPHNEPKGVQN